VKEVENWKKAKREGSFATRFFGVNCRPFKVVGAGSRGAVCDPTRVKVCRAFCCDFERFGFAPLNLFDVTLISRRTGLAPSRFLDVGGMAYCLSAGNSSVSELLRLAEQRNGYCLFDSGGPRYTCEIHEYRPLECRNYPYSINLTYLNHLLMIKTCPGFERGRMINLEEVKELNERARFSTAMISLRFNVEEMVLRRCLAGKRFEEVHHSFFDRLGLPYAEPVSAVHIEEVVDRIYDATNISEALVEVKLPQDKNYLIEKVKRLYPSLQIEGQ
jgi:Fe-S-cluster containining protein